MEDIELQTTFKEKERDLDNVYHEIFRMAENNLELMNRDRILESEGYDVIEVKRRAELEVKRKIQEILNFRRSPPLSYDEGDQSPLSGEASQLMRYQWASSMDYQPHNPLFFYLSKWLRTLYCGDYEGMMTIIGNKSQQEIKELLSIRETLYNIPAIFHVIIGARNLAVVEPQNQEFQAISEKILNVKRDWVRMLEKLISLGSSVSVRDVAGFTPLHHCCQRGGNAVTLKMAEILIKAGAEVNAQSRFGDTPLLNCTRALKDDFIQLLLSHGASPYITDNDGASAFSITSFFPKIQKMFGKANKKKQRQKREEMKQVAGGSLKKCSVCQVIKADNMKCTGCFFVYYCGKDCQREAWPSHKAECLALRSEFEDCIVHLQSYYGSSNLSDKFYVRKCGDLPRKGNFVVKVQVPIGGIGQRVNQVKGGLGQSVK